MLNRFFGPHTHTYLHVLGVAGLAFSLPLNKVAMSICMMFIALNFLLAGQYKVYLQNLKNSRLFLLIFAFILLHVVGLLWSDNMSYGMHDLRVKLPLLVIAVTLFAKPITNRAHVSIVLGSFVTSVLITSLINFLAYNQFFGEWLFNDIRGLSLFGSHVRYSLLVAMSIAILLLHPSFKSKTSILIRVVFILWFLYYSYYSQVLSGYIALSGVFGVAITYWLSKWKKWVAVTSILLISIGSIAVLIWVLRPISFNPEDYKDLEPYTSEGHEYYHKPYNITPETHKPIEIYISDFELRREWSKVSDVHYDSADVKGQPVRATLIRYMSSLDLRKDAKDFQKLTKSDIKKIEQGYASKYTVGVLARIYGLKFQLNNAKDPNGHSFLQRVEYWKTGLIIAKENMFRGVGTGDVQDEFDAVYNRFDSPLTAENRRRAHNMFLTVFLTFGMFGLFLFIWLHTEFLAKKLADLDMIAVSFIVIIMLSYCVEDTLETQTGITFFALFISLFSRSENMT